MLAKKYAVGATNGTSEPSHAATKPTTDENLVKINFKNTTVKPTKYALRMHWHNYRQRKCCKQGFRAGQRGYNCDINRHFASRVANMEHRLKQKFQGRRRMNLADRKLVKRIVRYCIKPGYKSLYKKCCSTAN